MLCMSNFDTDQKRGHPKNKGSWSANENGMPESSLADDQSWVNDTPPPAPTPEPAEDLSWQDAIPAAPLPETQRKLRGHKFFPAEMKKWPAIYANDSTALADVPFVAHYFVGSADWYISEVDQKTGEAFGYADLGLGGGEYGYINLPDLEKQVVRPSGFPQAVERDLGFRSGTKACDVIDKYRDAAA